jgi:hypothetical protein
MKKHKTTSDLITDAAKRDCRKVRVVFHPAYNEEMHSCIDNKELVKSLKQEKVEVFDVVSDSLAILSCLKSKSVKSIEFINEKKVKK